MSLAQGVLYLHDLKGNLRVKSNAGVLDLQSGLKMSSKLCHVSHDAHKHGI